MTTKVMIHEIPTQIKMLLCQLLDEKELWRELAKGMGYVDTETAKYYSVLASELAYQKHGSPSELLLDNWAEYYHSCTELFVLLNQMKNYAAMELLRPLVDSEYHTLIQNPEISEKILNCPLEMVSNEENPSDSTPIALPNNQSLKLSNNAERPGMSGGIPDISYAELTAATNNWSEDNLLGKGGFASVYEGSWKCTKVAIKRIDKRKLDDGTKIHIIQSKNEFKFLNSCRHDNVLALYGFSSLEGEYPCLVYQLMRGGTLASRLSKKNDHPPLTWNQRLMIAHGTARGLQFLHNFKEKPLIHGDIKPANILLDLELQPKIGDFGLAREGTEGLANLLQVSRVYGTAPYLPLDFISSHQLSPKVDTYSFGVVLFELATGLLASDTKRKDKLLRIHVNNAIATNTYKPLMDKSPADEDSDIFEVFIKIGAQCTMDSSDQRPEMREVFDDLDIFLTDNKK